MTFGDTPHSNCTSEPDIDKPYSSSDLCIANVIFVFNIFLLNIPADIIICSSIPPEEELVAVHLSGLRKSLVSGSGVLFGLLAVHPRFKPCRFQLDLERVQYIFKRGLRGNQSGDSGELWKFNFPGYLAAAADPRLGRVGRARHLESKTRQIKPFSNVWKYQPCTGGSFCFPHYLGPACWNTQDWPAECWIICRPGASWWCRHSNGRGKRPAAENG